MNYEKRVVVLGDELGNVINLTKNPKIGYIKVTQLTESISNSRWIKIESRNALIKGDIKSLKMLNYKSNQALDGKIIILESTIPFSIDFPERDYKIAGSTGVICKYNDMPIYRISKYTDDLTEEDQFVKLNNNDEINASRIINEMIESS